MTIDTTAVQSHVAPYDLVQKMRASIQIMGPLVARFGNARVAMPGGCNLGPRKIDIHLRGLAEMGGVVRSDHGFVEVTASRLHAVDMILDYPSVGATENLLMAAVMAEGTTTLENVAREPEIVDLCKFLVSMGADITGAGSSTVRVNGVDRDASGGAHRARRPHRSRNLPHHGAVTGGDVEVTGISPHVLDLFLSKLRGRGSADTGEHAEHPGHRRPRALLRRGRGYVAVSRLPHRPAGADDGAAVDRERASRC